MKKAYWIAKYKKINNQEALANYAEKAKKLLNHLEEKPWSEEEAMSLLKVKIL